MCYKEKRVFEGVFCCLWFCLVQCCWIFDSRCRNFIYSQIRVIIRLNVLYYFMYFGVCWVMLVLMKLKFSIRFSVVMIIMNRLKVMFSQLELWIIGMLMLKKFSMNEVRQSRVMLLVVVIMFILKFLVVLIRLLWYVNSRVVRVLKVSSIVWNMMFGYFMLNRVDMVFRNRFLISVYIGVVIGDYFFLKMVINVSIRLLIVLLMVYRFVLLEIWLYLLIVWFQVNVVVSMVSSSRMLVLLVVLLRVMVWLGLVIIELLVRLRKVDLERVGLLLCMCVFCVNEGWDGYLVDGCEYS